MQIICKPHFFFCFQGNRLHAFIFLQHIESELFTDETAVSSAFRIYQGPKKTCHPTKRLLITSESMMYCSPIHHRLTVNTSLNRHQYMILSAPVDYLFPNKGV